MPMSWIVSMIALALLFLVGLYFLIVGCDRSNYTEANNGFELVFADEQEECEEKARWGASMVYASLVIMTLLINYR